MENKIITFSGGQSTAIFSYLVLLQSTFRQENVVQSRQVINESP